MLQGQEQVEQQEQIQMPEDRPEAHIVQEPSNQELPAMEQEDRP